ncbi:EAL domain-containing protein [Martelella lutilitoris]|uniref:EAL domain-containing protein n=1 Tax=Martelella lutilitoris TaxID=2583532 RepID=A0A5C4JRT5_9HYPH|nr:EAL domain-containing protein [Martelella lutilitoris]TNB47891.1 EAL domain-containing protein [Martelella lutilitoris]
MSGSCIGCLNAEALPFDFSMAFQPIVNLTDGAVFAFEALARGPKGEGAGTLFAQLNDDNLYAFDQQCRVKAIELASNLGLMQTAAKLSINFMPRAIYEPRACIQLTLATGKRCEVSSDRLIFEFTESEVADTDKLNAIVTLYRELGFLTAVDDFGAGHSGLSLLANMPPDILKLDMELVRGIDTSDARGIMVKHLVAMAREMKIDLVCEGVETAGELAMLRDLGVELAQGYYLCRPAFEHLPRTDEIRWRP